jgi:hypothetical protein
MLLPRMRPRLAATQAGACRVGRPPEHEDRVTIYTKVIPPCPKCHRIDHVEEEDQSGSSGRWFLCDRCGMRYSAITIPPRR